MMTDSDVMIKLHTGHKICAEFYHIFECHKNEVIAYLMRKFSRSWIYEELFGYIVEDHIRSRDRCDTFRVHFSLYVASLFPNVSLGKTDDGTVGMIYDSQPVDDVKTYNNPQFGEIPSVNALVDWRTINNAVYVIGPECRTPPLKIGVTSNSAYERMKQIQIGHPRRLEVLYSVKHFDAYKVERAAHEKLSAHRETGEWFNVSLGAAVASIIDAIVHVDGIAKA